MLIRGCKLINGSLLHYISVQGRCQTGDDYITFSTGFKNLLKKCCHVFTAVYKEREPKNSDTGVKKEKNKVLPNVED